MVNNHQIRLVLLGAVFLSFACFSRSDAASFQGLGFLPGDTLSWAYDVSADGLVVVGYSSSGISKAFRWTASGGVQGLGFLPGGARSTAEGVSADGSVVVGYSWTGIDMQAFRWAEEDGMVGLGDLPGGGFWSKAFAVSADGAVVVGASSSASGYEAFRWTESGGMQGLGDLPGGQFYSEALDVSADGSVVVGWSKIASGGFQAFRWTESNGMVSIGGHVAEGVSDNGEVVVGYTSTQAFRWTVSGGMQLLGSLPGGDLSDAKAVSPDGSIVVGSARKNDNWQAIIWDASNGMRSIKDILEDEHGLDLTGWNLTYAYGISAGGSTIVGYAYPNNEGWIISFESPVIVPDVVGMSQPDAESEIAFANLSVGNITRHFSDTVPEGHVISQEPVGGTQVFIHSAVDLLISLGQPISSIIYVDNEASNGGNGTSWTKAFTNLRDALSAAESVDGDVNEIRVAEGVYKPDRHFTDPNGSGNRNATFQLINGVIVKGGYTGFGKTDPNARDIDIYKTVLSGDLNDNDVGSLDDSSREENSYHVVTGSETDANAILDGFTITGGNANGSYSGTNCLGGGMYDYSGSPTLSNCTFSGNMAKYNGGGVYNESCNSMLTNCIFSGNIAKDNGAGMYNYNSSPIQTNCTFSGNWANIGGGMYNYNSSPTLTNCTFGGNSAGHWGGGMYNFSDKPTLTNCILWGNSDNGGVDESAQIHGNTPVINYSCVQGWTGALGGTGNIGTDPCFADPNNGDYHLKSEAGRWKPSIYAKLDPTGDRFIDLVDFAAFASSWCQEGEAIPADLDNSGIVDLPDLELLLDNYLMSYTLGEWVFDDVNSPCIDAGDPASDWTAELWPHGRHINIGAHGGTPEASMSLSNAGNIADLNNSDLVDYADLLKFVNKWLYQEVLLREDLDRDGVVDFADFSIFANNWFWEE